MASVIRDKVAVRLSEVKQQWGAFQFYVVGILLFSVAIYIGFTWGNKDNLAQQQQISQLNQTLDNLQIENNSLTKKLNILGVELEVARLAENLTNQEIQQGLLREKVLRTDLGFYQQVMAPELKPKGFVIEAFYLESTLSDRHFRFELVLMQQEKIRNIVKGKIKVSILGSENGRAKTFSLHELMHEQAEPLSFSFKYFQVIEGELKMPENFEAEKILVHADIYQFKRKRGILDKSFDWQLALTDQQ
ncbi:MAG: hypothetical protein ACI965_000699 [Paraglaciecola sp.]|jgi:hypothetical protein